MKKLFGAILASSLLLAACSTVIPPGLTDTQASFDGNVQNSGFIGFESNGSGILTPRAYARYNLLAGQYGKQFIPPVKPGDGCLAYTNGTWLIDRQHLAQFQTMNQWKKEGRE